MGISILFVLAAAILSVAIFHVYVYSCHRISDIEDYRIIGSTLLTAPKQKRCGHFDGRLRCLPNVILIGSSKCGTTSLVNYLKQHQNVRFVQRRLHKIDKHSEVHRFDRNTYGLAVKALDLADEWASSPEVDSENTTVIHYTPHYIFAPTVPYEMKRFYPHAGQLKFVVILREPMARAWSSYWFQNSHLLQDMDRGIYLHGSCGRTVRELF
jgi:hypothetical protein